MVKWKEYIIRMLYVLACIIAVPVTVFPQDTLAVQAKIDEARALFSQNPAGAIRIAFQANALARETENKRLLAYSLNTIGSAYNYLEKSDTSLFYHEQALEIQKTIGDELGMGRSYTNIGIALIDLGLNDKAIENFLKAEEKFVKVRFDIGLGKLYNSMGYLFFNVSDYTNSIKYYKKGLILSEKLDDPVLNYSLRINLANAYGSVGKAREALLLYHEGYEMARQDSNYSDLVIICNDICHEYIDINKYDSAAMFNNEALRLIWQYGFDYVVSSTAYSNRAAILSRQERMREAIQYVDSALAVLPANQELMKQIALKSQLGVMLHKTGDYERSFDVLTEALMLKDTLYQKNLKEKLSEINTVHEVEKKEQEIEMLSSSQKQQRLINYLLAGVALVLVVFLMVAIRSYRRKKRDNAIIRQQKNEMSQKNAIIEQKHKEITDSINYAERIQRSCLATDELLDNNLGEYFVFFRPKDVVSGDFYWAGKMNNGRFVMVTADSTGHGVPGAIMSLLNITSIEGAIKDGHHEPSAILNETRKTIIERLKNDGSAEGGKDGMDCSLCVYDFAAMKLYIAAANNPVWIVRKKEEGQVEILEIKPDKMPVGKHDKDQQSFTQQTIDLQTGDVIYTLTDGFPDQFGGSQGKKFMNKKLRELLAANAHLPMTEQKQLLEKTFSDWVGNLEQVDDITVVGIRL